MATSIINRQGAAVFMLYPLRLLQLTICTAEKGQAFFEEQPVSRRSLRGYDMNAAAPVSLY